MSALQRVANEGVATLAGRSPKERDFRTSFIQALSSVLREEATDLTVGEAEYAARMDDFPGVGHVDVAVSGRSPVPDALIELKWGGRTLWNCVWDAAKLALAVRVQAGRSGFLIAGAPARAWEKPERGADLFGDSTSEIEDFLEAHADLFAFWRKEILTRPLRLPTPITTTAVACVPLEVEGALWELRCSRVDAPGEWSVRLDQNGEILGRERATASG